MEYWLLRVSEISKITDGSISGFWLVKDAKNPCIFSAWQPEQEVCIWRRTCVAIVSSFVTQIGDIYEIDAQIHECLLAKVSSESECNPEPPPRRLSYEDAYTEAENDRIQTSINVSLENLSRAKQWSIEVKTFS